MKTIYRDIRNCSDSKSLRRLRKSAPLFFLKKLDATDLLWYTDTQKGVLKGERTLLFGV